jgi:hypothetical protein
VVGFLRRQPAAWTDDRDPLGDAATGLAGGATKCLTISGAPGYLSFLGLVWFVPVVTLGRAVLIAILTVSTSVCSVRKDRRLLFYVGDEYRSHQADAPLVAALMTR